MQPSLPRKFFKYQSRATARAVLTGVKLRWSTPATLNDPFDIQFDLSTDIDEKVVVSLALDKLWRCYVGELQPQPFPGNAMWLPLLLLRHHPNRISRSDFEDHMRPGVIESLALGRAKIPAALEESRALMSTSKVLCLSETGDNLLLWAHYAESHRGVALIFRPIEDSPYTLARPVQYVTEVPRLFDEHLLSDIFAGLRTIDAETALEHMAFTKSSHWNYEREWRIFAGDGRDKYAPFEDVPFGREELAGIVMGARTPLTDRDELAKLAVAVNPEAKIYQAELTPKFGITVRKA